MITAGSGLLSAREYPAGSVSGVEQLPDSRLKTQIKGLHPAGQTKASQWMRSFHFTDQDLPSLHADSGGGIFYACQFPAFSGPSLSSGTASGGGTPVPVSPFPTNLFFHSRPGAPNVLFINFSGETVTNTQWNTEVGRTSIPAKPFSTDFDYTTFSDLEQMSIKRIWQRMAEDYAPFNIDVTTERPATFNNRTAHALITATVDANGDANPFNAAGGVGYVNVFNTVYYPQYRPAWIYVDNLANEESYIAEAASHEIGHNLGLSHDGRTDGMEYYNGHGYGETSWAPIMGAGYNRNVSQWSKGDYYLASNTEDDLAIIAGKISYRADDHGGTAASATALVISPLTNIISTTPENDPGNTNTANKGVLERNNDVDVFSFITGTGLINIQVNPWVMPSGTRGGNIDVAVELYNEAGILLLSNNSPSQTGVSLQTNLDQGRYFLFIHNVQAGNPFSSTPDGYTSYGGIGRYFINGNIVAPTNYVPPPLATVAVTNISTTGKSNLLFSVTYTDNAGINVSSLDSNDVRVTGPNGYNQLAQFVSVNITSNGTPRTAMYSIRPTSGSTWQRSDNGVYTLFMQANQVSDTEGAWVTGGQLGQFQVVVPVVIYSASMDADPGWTLDSKWAYGKPAYTSTGPTRGYTGTNIIAYNLSGNYENSLTAKYATTPAINCAGSTMLTLHFKRWLRTKNNDPVSIQASTNGTTWTNVWSTSSAVSDTAWQDVQYNLPAGIAGNAAVRLRWSLASTVSQNDIGWNIDDVELLGDSVMDVTPPSATLNVANIIYGGSPSHTCTVQYNDETAVRLSSLDSQDLYIAGPNGYSNILEFIGADLPLDGSPINATYSIAAPGVVWNWSNNGTYAITLLEGAVEDTLYNTVTQQVLGAFTVAIAPPAPGRLVILPGTGLSSTGMVGGVFYPSSISYTLTNSGQSSLDWSASANRDWISLSHSNGALSAGESVVMTVSINSNATNLAAGNYQGQVDWINVTTGSGNTNRAVVLTVNPVPKVELLVTINNPLWGSVTPSNGLYNKGTVVQLNASPAAYCQFREWQGAVTGTNNGIMVQLMSNTPITAIFAEQRTVTNATPYWWLASVGYTNNFESAVNLMGSNGISLWQSYIAGLNPADPESKLVLSSQSALTTGSGVLSWSPVTGRVYTLWLATNLAEGFLPLPGAVNLPSSIHSFTNAITPGLPVQLYRIEVQKP